MSFFTVVKFVHILLAIIAFGFNATYALWIVRAQRQPEHLDFALRGVKILDDYFANPAYLLLLISGLTIVLGYAVYTPPLRGQIRALEARGPGSEEFRKLSTRGTVVGIVLAVLVLLILIMMVFKPTF